MCFPAQLESQLKQPHFPSDTMSSLNWKTTVNEFQSYAFCFINRLTDIAPPELPSAGDLYRSICRQRYHVFLTCSALHRNFSLLLQAGGDCFQNQTEESVAGSEKLAEPQQVRSGPACVEMITDANAHSQTFAPSAAANAGYSLNMRSKADRNAVQVEDIPQASKLSVYQRHKNVCVFFK